MGHAEFVVPIDEDLSYGTVEASAAISAPTFDDAVPPQGTFQDTAEEQLASAHGPAGVVPGYTYTKEDDEADSVFDQIDAKMKNETKKKKNEKVDDKSKRQKNESVHDQFKDLKAEMSTVSWTSGTQYQTWGHDSKHHKPERFMPVPEKLILERLQTRSLYSPEFMVVDIRRQMLENKLDDVKQVVANFVSTAKDNGVNESVT